MKNFIQSILLLLAMTLFINPTFSQVQIGNDILGEASLDLFGGAVSISADGNRIAVSAHANDTNGSNAGIVQVYDWNGTDWEQAGNSLFGSVAESRFGRAVALSGDGNLLAVSEYNNETSSNSAGYVKIYSLSGGSWVQLGEEIEGEDFADRAGDAIAMSFDGYTVAIGAKENDGFAFDAGHVRVYRYSSGWNQLGDDINGEALDDLSGTSVSLSNDGNRVAIGSPGSDANGENSGQVRIFDWTSQDWVQVGNNLNGEAEMDESGISNSLSGDGQRIAIGAFRNDDGGEDRGQVRIYEWLGNGWSQMGNDIEGVNDDHGMGRSVALSTDGSRVAIGSLGHPSYSCGQVRVYDWNGSGWAQSGDDIGCDDPNDSSEVDVAISANGTRLIVGAETSNGLTGRIQVFALEGDLINDQPCQAISVPTDGSIQSLFSNTTATVEANEQSIVPTENDCTTSWCENNIQNSVWFTFVAPPSGSVEISTCDLADFDTQIALYATDNCNFYSNFQLIQANDDGPESCSTGYDSWMQVDGLSSGQSYYILVDGYDGAVGTFSIYVLDLMPSSTDQITSNSSSLTIYPTPNDGNFFVEMEGLNQPAQLNISDAMGRVIYVESLSGIESKIELSLEELTSGLYFVTIQSASGNLSRKFYIR